MQVFVKCINIDVACQVLTERHLSLYYGREIKISFATRSHMPSDGHFYNNSQKHLHQYNNNLNNVLPYLVHDSRLEEINNNNIIRNIPFVNNDNNNNENVDTESCDGDKNDNDIDHKSHRINDENININNVPNQNRNISYNLFSDNKQCRNDDAHINYCVYDNNDEQIYYHYDCQQPEDQQRVCPRKGKLANDNEIIINNNAKLQRRILVKISNN